MEVMCFNCTAADLVCNGERDPGRVQNLPRGSGVWGREWGGGGGNCAPLLLLCTIQPDKGPLANCSFGVLPSMCSNQRWQQFDQGMQSANCKQFSMDHIEFVKKLLFCIRHLNPK